MANRPARKSFTERRKLALGEFREQAIEALSQLSSLILVADNGDEFEIPHPMLISDEAQTRVESVQSGADLDKDEEGKFLDPPKIDGEPAGPFVIRFARALMGDDWHGRFIAAGGHSKDVEIAWGMLVEEQKGIMESDPK